MRKGLLDTATSVKGNSVRVDKRVIELLGPVLETSLMPGEKVAVRSRRVLSRKGRCVVRVRVFGSASLGWLDASMLWGACVEAFICPGGRVKHLAEQLYPDVYIASWASSLLLPPHRHWDGVLVGTIKSEEEAEQYMSLVERWTPKIVILTCHISVSRKRFAGWSNCSKFGYDVHHQQCHHEEFGGVSISSWRLMIAVKSSDVRLDFCIKRMTAGLYPRHLQTALDDTVGPSKDYLRLDRIKQESPSGDAGLVQPSGIVVEGTREVFDGNSFAPDLAVLESPAMHHLWVLAVSVFSKDRVVRKINVMELLAIWDYAGKIWYKDMNRERLAQVLQARILSPPGKILTTVCFHVYQQCLDAILPQSELTFDPKHEVDTREKKVVGAMELRGIQRAKAALADDAAVDLSYWAMPNETPAQSLAREFLRRFAHRWWVYNLAKEAYSWLRTNGNTPKDRAAIEECIKRAAGSDYWEWHRGSKLFFWRFPEECNWRKDARDGTPFWHISEPPTGLHFQNIPTSTREGELQIRVKVFQLAFRWYIEHRSPKLLIPRFGVEKVSNEAGQVLDIRTVWDATRNGLNGSIWCPSFALPTIQNGEDLVVKWLLIPVGDYLRGGSPPQDYTQDQSLFIKSWQFDHDVGQMFNNFTLHEDERDYHGIRFISTRNDGSPEPQSFMRCTALAFGVKASPYLAIQGEERIMEMCMGDPHALDNPFQYEQCWLNLPTSPDYDPSMPRVLLLKKNGELAAMKVTFVDDLHAADRGKTAAPAREAARVIATRMNYYGNQVAARKVGPPTLIPRAWNGFMTHTDEPYPVKGTTTKKWKRGRAGLQWIWDQCGIPDDTPDPIAYIEQLPSWDVRIDTSELRRIAGLWIHLTEVYTEGRCFIKGFFNAMEAFRSNRDLDGWRLAAVMDEALQLELTDASRAQAAGDYPVLTRVTYQMVLHTQALRKLFAGEEPRVVLIRPMEKHHLRYACGDASAEGFAQAVQYPNLEVDERDGLWLPEMSAKSSNLREALNIANHIKRDIREGRHDNCEIWQATDNAVWCAVCNKGMSSVRHLFDLLVEIKLLAHEHNVFYHCFHISGERMIATGIDGMSRGDKESGIALGYDLRNYLPLDTSAFDYPGNSLEEWCRGWMGDDYSPPAAPIDWFLKIHKPGIHVIAPPPAAALHALTEVARSRHKRPEHVQYVILIPRLLYQEEWRSRFQKEVDIWFTLHTGEFWPHSAFEPLMIGLSFPMYRTRPWLLRQERDKVVELGRTLSLMSEQSNIRVRDHLCKLWSDPRAFLLEM